ncbi:AAA family ATPase [Fodinicola acaciae]|uniref:AAA family ATPase n=1 Tax=Fodinicola acaciae TaxID=2681555 RepID=UPI0013D418B3|nr:AAA family ATPase [Fodinicola acaciae]
MLDHVYWIGGGSGGGKSTVARRLADAYDLRLYVTDEVMGEHARRSTPADSPQLSRFLAMDMDQRWLDRTPEVMLETFHWFRGEGFGFIVDDLRAMPRPVIAEGLRLLPHLVRPLLSDPRHAVWLLPTADFRRAAFASRGDLWKIAGRTSDPERALRNLLARDRMFTDRLREQTKGLQVIEVDPRMTEDELVNRVARLFGLAG